MSAFGPNRALKLAQRRRMNFFMNSLAERSVLAEAVAEETPVSLEKSEAPSPVVIPADFSLPFIPEAEKVISIPA